MHVLRRTLGLATESRHSGADGGGRFVMAAAACSGGVQRPQPRSWYGSLESTTPAEAAPPLFELPASPPLQPAPASTDLLDLLFLAPRCAHPPPETM